MLQKDKQIIRDLAQAVSEIASMPAQNEKRQLWKSLNGLKPQRPMVMIDQVCWNEMNYDGSLDLLCENDECRSYEQGLRRLLFQWKHFPVDMVVEPFVSVPKAIINTGFGVDIEEDILFADPKGDVAAHKYKNVFQTEEDIEKIKIPEITHDIAETNRLVDFANELFDSILEVRSTGQAIFAQVWDSISMYMGAEGALYTLIDEPEYMHRLVRRMVDSLAAMISQLEDKGLLLDIHSQTTVHCSGAYTDELPAAGYNPDKPRCKDVWVAGLAQMFSMVSPEMHKEFELEYMNPIFERFGLVYYGCCEPLDKKLDIVKKIPNLRKVSMSPWTDAMRGAAELGSDFIFSSKPNPAFLAMQSFEEKIVHDELTAIKHACEQHKCPFELILKDISTTRYDHKRLCKWADIAMDIVNG